MAFLSVRRPHLELLAIKRKLNEGEISATDASHVVAELLFDSGDFVSSPAKEIWRQYDAAIAKLTIEMLEKITS